MLFYYLDTSFKLWNLTIAKNLIPQTKDVIIFLLKHNQERTSNITYTGWKENPANIRLDEEVFILRLRKTSSRRLQDVFMKTNLSLLKTNIFVLSIRLQDVFKMFSRRLQDIFKTSSRRLAITSSRRFQDVFKTSCKIVFKTSSRHLQDVFKTSSRRLANTSWRHLQEVLKTYHQVKLFLLTSLWEVFSMFVRRTAKSVVYRRVHLQ